jgi:MFS family permease
VARTSEIKEPAMMPMPQSLPAPVLMSAGTALRGLLVVGLMAFLTVVDLFATQAILPALAHAYGAAPAAMSFAVNASTIGMAVAGLVTGFLGRRIDRRAGIIASLALLSIPTLLLATMPNLAFFAALRIVQGLLMASAFTLTLAYLAENNAPRAAASALAAYITGNVASNLFGRLISAAVADHLGLASNFLAFAMLNVSGALLASIAIPRAPAAPPRPAMVGLPLLLVPALPAVMLGMVLVSVGTFLAQAVATGFVGRTARFDRAAASGLYLASYFSGGLAGSVVLGQVYDHIGWPACVAGIGCALILAIVLTRRMTIAATPGSPSS